ncbi:unnamed protein product [Rotaria sordida]|uniref:PDZ domain-containing protein n=1 Tax=Rotaria sordida TaxID=392033 RepID=A0A818K1W4_9BILA|nr:unnamed protein product [Rotaria sordida]CAF0919861.1 unnamed protein product [Rotaria sordida]CAF3493120.1 unnamed protein product [Rotaria sordida]CAF3544332.1 unnamed protein product [Rotaria sordida]
MNSPITVRLERNATDRPWGFRLQGGSDFSIPLSVQLVNPDTPAHENGLSAGDQVIAINGRNITHLSHQEAKMEITRSGNDLELTIIKGVVNQQSMPTPQPISQLRTGPVHQMPTPQAVKPSFATPSQPQMHVGSSHNRAAMPFDARVGNEMTYQAAKPTNWQPGDYTQEVPENLRPKLTNFESTTAYNKDPLQREIWRPKAYRDNPQAPARNVGTAVYHAQYNSPIGLYSDDKVLEAFKSQAGSLIEDIKGANSNNNPSQSSNTYNPEQYNQPSPTYQAVMNTPPKNVPYSSEAKISRSFRALEEDLSSVQGTSQAPKSIFDQRRQQQQQQQLQQQQAAGFRSVKPPDEVPPEQQRRPYHTEYQVEHVQQNWMEPKK